MNEIKPNEPFNANKEQEEYGKYQKSEGYVKHKGEDISIDYKSNTIFHPKYQDNFL